jgi:hypothetical protein
MSRRRCAPLIRRGRSFLAHGRGLRRGSFPREKRLVQQEEEKKSLKRYIYSGICVLYDLVEGHNSLKEEANDRNLITLIIKV